MNEIMGHMINSFVSATTELLLPCLVGSFLIAAFLRTIIYFTVRCEYKFATEFEKRVHRYLAHEGPQEPIHSFHQLVKKILETTYYEIFELKKKYRRRRFDNVTTLTDRMFLIQEGVARLIKDALSQTQYLKKGDKTPRFLDISKYVFGANPVFNRVLGILPMGVFNDILNILPGIFVIGGIFGNFLGVMQALPQLSNMDITNVDATKKVMDAFLLHVAFSMGTSIVGIGFSVIMTILNAAMNPEGTYLSMVNKFTSSMEFLWNDTDNNEMAGDENVDRRTVAFANRAAKGAEAPAKDPLQKINDPLLDAWAPEGQEKPNQSILKPTPPVNLDIGKRAADKRGMAGAPVLITPPPAEEVKAASVALVEVAPPQTTTIKEEAAQHEEKLRALQKERDATREKLTRGELNEAEWIARDQAMFQEEERLKRLLESMAESDQEAA